MATPKAQAELFGIRYLKTSAVFDGPYRYLLTREWDAEVKRVVWCACNPSIATAEVSDPTITREIGFAKSWGYGGLVQTNIYALVSTDPKPLRTHLAPVGPENDRYILEAALSPRCGRFVAAWGDVGGKVGTRAQEVLEMLRANGVEVWCLGKTKNNNPVHPLYIPGNRELRRFE